MVPLNTDIVLKVVVGGIATLIFLALLLALVAIRLRLRNEARARKWKEREATWTPVFLDVLSGVTEAKELQKLVSRREARAFVGFLTTFSSRLKGRELGTIERIAEPWLPEIMRDLDHRSAEERARAVQTIGELGMPVHVDVLISALDDEAPLVAMVAARRLMQPGNEDCFETVLERLDRFRVWDRRFVSGLLVRAGPTIVERLRELLSDEQRTPFERVVALDALTVAHDLATADYAVRLLGDDDHSELRVAALRHLRRTGVSDHAVRIRDLLRHPDSSTRQGAALALGAVGTAERDAVHIADLLDDPSPWVRVGAAEALSSLGARGLLQEAAAREGPEGEVAREALRQ